MTDAPDEMEAAAQLFADIFDIGGDAVGHVTSEDIEQWLNDDDRWREADS